ncbi:multifunctional CCA addition/repair protein [Thalassotalea piscium]|uniref:Multifunctional CCA protein n=1 Tax=Thalassotalea piscium TaxID=1230533 RepID=A0A7X0TTE0_9GAMM|nr:multifunctional CCA addition/repair protein [Thalassotalea piscium]MBB6543029.1 tRNA nucleotidyltransferase (CCA-adding enzyme) [Thalassotalea piscium]
MSSKQISESLTFYLVGGAVRDQLLNRPILEKDYVVIGSTPEQMLSLGFTQVGKDFPVFLHPKTKEEYALARTEKKQGQGYTGFTCNASPDVTLEQDLARRDLTVNAMALDKDGNITDPFNGLKDLENRILRHVSNAFTEDPLRVLRVARFASRYYYLGFTVADETIALMTQISESGELLALSAERVWKEIERSLTERNPEVFIQTLRECKALELLWPELNNLWGIPNPAQWHPEICSGIHTMMVLQQACKLTEDPVTRFAALCHDLGKSVTPRHLWPSHHGHEKAGLPLIEQFCKKYRVPNQYKKLALLVSEFHLHCHKAFELNPKTILRVFDKINVWRDPTILPQVLLSCQADFNGRLGNEDAPYPQADYLTKLYNACTKVTAKPYVEQGLKGQKIKEAIYKARLTMITSLKNCAKTHDGKQSI